MRWAAGPYYPKHYTGPRVRSQSNSSHRNGLLWDHRMRKTLHAELMFSHSPPHWSLKCCKCGLDVGLTMFFLNVSVYHDL